MVDDLKDICVLVSYMSICFTIMGGFLFFFFSCNKSAAAGVSGGCGVNRNQVTF